MRQAVKTVLACGIQCVGAIERFERRERPLYILMFHRINPVENPLGLGVTPELFEDIIVFLKNKYEILAMDQAVENLAAQDKQPGCVLTFDDGYRDNFDFAFPVLVKHQIPATIFVTMNALDTGIFDWDLFDHAVMTTQSEWLDLKPFALKQLPLSGDRRATLVGLHKQLKQLPANVRTTIVSHVISTYGSNVGYSRTMLNWEEARVMANSGLVTIGAHTKTHPILSRVAQEQAEDEIIDGKRGIEERLGLPVHYFAYPNGGESDFNDDHVGMAKKAGYRAACSTYHGSNSSCVDLFRLKRVDVTTRMATDAHGRFSSLLFRAKMSGVL